MGLGNKRGSLGVFPIDDNDKIFALLKGVDSLRRLIGFFELLGTYVGIRLWAPFRSCNKDLIWTGIPISTDDQCGDYILKKKYTSDRPTSSRLRELAVHNLTNNLTVMSSRCAVDSRI